MQLLKTQAIIILYYARWQHKNKKKNRAVKMKNTHNYRRKIKRKNNKCVSRTDTNPPFAFQTAFPGGTDFSVSTGKVKKLHTLLVSLYF